MQLIQKPRLALFGLSFLLALGGTGLQAQSTSGTVSGQVTDPQGAAVPGAEIKLTSEATKAVRTTTTADSGRYNFFNVEPGVYDVAVSKDGFSQAKFQQQTVQQLQQHK